MSGYWDTERVHDCTELCTFRESGHGPCFTCESHKLFRIDNNSGLFLTPTHHPLQVVLYKRFTQFNSQTTASVGYFPYLIRRSRKRVLDKTKDCFIPFSLESSLCESPIDLRFYRVVWGLSVHPTKRLTSCVPLCDSKIV